MTDGVNERYQMADLNQSKAGEYVKNSSIIDHARRLAEPVTRAMIVSSAGAAFGAAVGGPPGAGVGFLTGSTAGTISGVVHICIDGYSDYKAWLQANKEAEIYRELEEIEELQQYLCPITYEFIMDPVRSPAGHTYDRTSILRDENINENGLVKDPFRNPSFAIEDLVEVPEFFAEMQIAILAVLRKDVEDEQISAGIKEGLEAFMKGLEKEIAERNSFAADQALVQENNANASKGLWGRIHNFVFGNK